MGGKTQQRVAGNVKPSSSGRIRELLINKHGAGNIITFSALSNAPQQQQQPIEVEPKPISKSTQGEADVQSAEAVSENISPTPPSSQTLSSSDKPTLVVRRIGNRDYFTRIKNPKEVGASSSSSSLASGAQVIISKASAGVKKPNYTDDQFVSSSCELKLHENDEQNLGDGVFADELSKEEKPEDKATHDFDDIIEQLARMRLTNGNNATESLNKLNPEIIARECELIRLLRILVKEFKDDLSIEEWDIVNNSIHKWIDAILKSSDQLARDSMYSNFCVNVFNFIYELILLAKTLKTIENLAEEFPMMQSLLDDWENFHSSKAYHDLIILYFKLAQFENTEQDFRSIVEALAHIVIDVDPKMVISNINLLGHLSAKVEFDPDSRMPNNIRFCNINEDKFKGFTAIVGLLKNNHRVILVTAHAMLRKIMATICESFEASTIMSDQDDIDEILIAPPAALFSILSSRDSIMSALLSDYKSGDVSVTMEPNADSYSCALSYLFIWDLVIQFIVNMDKEVGHCIIHCLKKLGLIQRLLDNVFMLLPPLGERDSLKFKVENDLDISNQRWCLSEFLKSPLKTTATRPINEIELTALHVYFSVAWHMPVTVRKWFNNNSNKRLCNLVNEYTVKHISEVICSLEMETVQEKCQERANEDKLNNLMIKARPTVKEVYTVYERDEFRMELTIKLPINYPLGPVQIDGGQRVGVEGSKWRKWLLKLTTFLAHQNGPILDGIDLWRRNIDKRFEGVEKCMICFSILHSNYQLPKKKCQTCSKMFHNLCLYKWFESSGNSTCPLCRNIW